MVIKEGQVLLQKPVHLCESEVSRLDSLMGKTKFRHMSYVSQHFFLGFYYNIALCAHLASDCGLEIKLTETIILCYELLNKHNIESVMENSHDR